MAKFGNYPRRMTRLVNFFHWQHIIIISSRNAHNVRFSGFIYMPRVLVLSMEENINFLEQDEHVPMQMRANPAVNFSVKSFLADRNKDLGPRPPSKLGKNETAVACICGTTDDNYGELGWVQCDACFVWQHIKCVGYDEDNEKDTPYYCERCDQLNTRVRPYTMEEAAQLVKDLIQEEEDEESEVVVPVKKRQKKTESFATRELTREKRRVKEPSPFSPPAKKGRSSFSSTRGHKEKSSAASTPRPRGRPPKASTPRLQKGKPSVTSTPRPRGRPPKSSTSRSQEEKPSVTSTPRPKRGRPSMTSSTKKDSEHVSSILPSKREALNELKERLPTRRRPLIDHQSVSRHPAYLDELEPFSHKVVHKAAKKLAKQVTAENFELPADDGYYNERLALSTTRETVAPQSDVIAADKSVQESDVPLTDQSVVQQKQSTEEDKHPESEKKQTAAPAEEIKTGRRLSLEEYQLLRKDTGHPSAAAPGSAKRGFIPPLVNAQTSHPLTAIKNTVEAQPNEAGSVLNRYCFEQPTETVQHCTRLTYPGDGPEHREARIAFFKAGRAREEAKGEMSFSKRMDRIMGISSE